MFAWLNKQIEWVKSFLQEPNGKASSKRLFSAGVVTVFLVAYLKISILTSSLEDIPPMWAVMIAAILGLNIIDKMMQMRYGNGNSKRPPDPPPPSATT